VYFPQVINKQGDSCFTANDEKVFSSYLQFCGIGLRNAQLYEKSQLEVKRNQVSKECPVLHLTSRKSRLNTGQVFTLLEVKPSGLW
jgi:hypothetical protein